MTHEDEPLPAPEHTGAPDHGLGHVDDDAPFDDFESGGKANGLRGMVDKNPVLKIGLIVGGIVVVVGAFMLFSGTGKKTGPMSIIKGSSSNVSEVPGAGPVSDVYKRAVQETNAADVEKAIKTGGSALPVPIISPVGRVPTVDSGAPQEDPLERWRHIQDDRAREQQQQQHSALPQQDPNANAVKELSTAMSQQMSSILQGARIGSIQHQTITDPKFLEEEEKKEKEKELAAAKSVTGASPAAAGSSPGTGSATGAGTGAAGSATTAPAAPPVNIIQPVGSIVYAQMLTEANSDVPGPILAEIVGGPLAGTRAVGTFTDENDEYLVLKFNTIVIDGIPHATEAYAVDPATTLTALETDIDHRYFERIVLPAAASFVEGLGSAIAQQGSTVSQSNSSTTVATPPLNLKQQIFSGVSTAAQQASTIIGQDASKVKVLVVVAAGTPMGILFMQPVTDQTTQ